MRKIMTPHRKQKPKQVLMMYITRVSGHRQATVAIQQSLRELDPLVRVPAVNGFGYTYPVLEKVVNGAYMSVIKRTPKVWDYMYDNPKIVKKSESIKNFLHKTSRDKIARLFSKYKPDTVVCTQAFPCGMIADHKISSESAIKLFGVLTDYAPHSYWVYDSIDGYFVPARDVGQRLVENGIPENRINDSGIPVNPKFTRLLNKGAIYERLGLDPGVPVILVMGGSQGLGAMEEAVRPFMKDAEHGYQLLVVAGSNRKLYNRLRRRNRKSENGHIKILSFVENIDELMEISDLIVTKAGGMTTAEALVKNLPILIVSPIPGHERMNADFLVDKGAAIEVSDHRRIYDETNRLFDSKGTLEGMRRDVEKISKPDSAIDTAKLAFERN